MVTACNPSTWEAEAGGWEFEASLDYIDSASKNRNWTEPKQPTNQIKNEYIDGVKDKSVFQLFLDFPNTPVFTTSRTIEMINTNKENKNSLVSKALNCRMDFLVFQKFTSFHHWPKENFSDISFGFSIYY
jgi:hypothetical protein